MPEPWPRRCPHCGRMSPQCERVNMQESAGLCQMTWDAFRQALRRSPARNRLAYRDHGGPLGQTGACEVKRWWQNRWPSLPPDLERY